MFGASKENTLIWLLQDETELVMTSMTTNHHVACCGSDQCSLLSATLLCYCSANVYLRVLLYFILEHMKSARNYSSVYEKSLYTCASL